MRSSPRTLSRRLREAGHAARPPPVGRLLTTGGDARHVNAMTSEAPAHHPDRTAQFDYSARQRQTFAAAGLPISSVDTTKKELIGGLHEQPGPSRTTDGPGARRRRRSTCMAS